MGTVRDRLWLWGHSAGSHTTTGQWGLERPSRITPTEACHYMGIPNCIMVVYGNRPSPPFHQVALAMSSLDRVVWSIVGDAGTTRTNQGASDLDEVLRVAERFPNIRGAMMDDFFHSGRARQTPDDLGEFRRRLRAASTPLDLWVVLYSRQLDLDIEAHLEHCDVVSFWTMVGRELSDLERSFEAFVRKTDGKRRALGCYMWNYGEKRPLEIERMRHQCSLGLKWLKEGTIESMIFLASCICDLELEAVEWTRRWVAEVGAETVQS